MTDVLPEAGSRATRSGAAISPTWWSGEPGAQFRLTEHDDAPVLVCSGELDITSSRVLHAALRALDGRRARVAVDLSDVGFADTHGLAPLFESARRRRAEHSEPIEISRTSRPVDRVLALLQVPSVGPVDVRAWDAAAVRAWPLTN